MARTSIATDNFNRADSGNPGSNYSGSLNQDNGGDAGITGNLIIGGAAAGYTSGGAAYRWVGTGTFTADQYAKCILGAFDFLNGSYFAGVILRASADTNAARDWYAVTVEYDGGTNRTTRIWKVVNGTATSLGTASVAWVNGDTLAAEVTGTTTPVITAYRATGGGGESQVLQVTDTSSVISATGAPGFVVAGSVPTLDDLDIGNVTTAIVLAGDAVALATATGALTTAVRLNAAAAAVSLATAHLNAVLQANAFAQATATGSIGSNTMAAAAVAAAAAQGTLTGIAAALQGAANSVATGQADFLNRVFAVQFNNPPAGITPAGPKSNVFYAWFPSIAAMLSAAVAAGGSSGSGKTVDAAGNFSVPGLAGLSVGPDQGFAVVADIDAVADDVEGGYIGSLDVL